MNRQDSANTLLKLFGTEIATLDQWMVIKPPQRTGVTLSTGSHSQTRLSSSLIMDKLQMRQLVPLAAMEVIKNYSTIRPPTVNTI